MPFTGLEFILSVAFGIIILGVQYLIIKAAVFDAMMAVRKKDEQRKQQTSDEKRD